MLPRGRYAKWLLITRSDFFHGCVINGPITDSNVIASNHSPFDWRCPVCGQPWAEHRVTAQIKARQPMCACFHGFMVHYHNRNSASWVSHQSIFNVLPKYQWLVKNPSMMKSRNSNGMLSNSNIEVWLNLILFFFYWLLLLFINILAQSNLAGGI